MQKKLHSLRYLLVLIVFLTGCSSRSTQDNSSKIMSIQIIDRNGFTETISNKDRIATYKEVDFLQPQPYQKVLRVFGRNAQQQNTSKITSYHENGQPWQYLEVINGRAHGYYREWFSNGQLKIESFLIEGLADIHELAQRSWVFDGLSRVWDEQGHLIAEIPYHKGVLHSSSLYYHGNGKLHKKIPYETGVIEGDVLIYNENENLLEKIPYSLGQKQGIAHRYWDLDKPLYEEEYNYDLLQKGSYYDPKGNLMAHIENGKGYQALFEEKHLHSLIEYNNGVPEGTVSLFNEDGTLQCTYTWKEGKKNGEECEYYSSKPEEKPQVKLSVHWHDDKLQGIVTTWYPNGIMESQREVNGNKKQGLCFAWYKNADLMLMEEYENDLLVKGAYFKKADKSPLSKIEGGKGIATLYTSDGIFIRKVSYEKGLPKLDDEFLQ